MNFLGEQSFTHSQMEVIADHSPSNDRVNVSLYLINMQRNKRQNKDINALIQLLVISLRNETPHT